MLEVSDGPAFNPDNTNIDWSDVEAPNLTAVKKILGDNKVMLAGDVEKRSPDGKFRSFVIPARPSYLEKPR